MIRRAKVVATIGPSSESIPILEQLVLSGIDVARLNFSHGTHEEHAIRISTIRQISKKLEKPISILQDLQGPKLRVGNLKKEGIELVTGDHITLTMEEHPRQIDDRLTIPMDVPDLTGSITKGHRILLDDGNLELQVVSIDDNAIDAIVTLGGKLTSHKGVNFPGINLKSPSFTEKDREDLIFGLQHEVDAIAISFVNNARDVENVREEIQRIDASKIKTPIIAKLERPQAIENLEEIIMASDGVMVARGDLAVETSPSIVPIVQKRIIETANRYNKQVITATQMLDSMIHNPRPTRAEASDVANAIFDGSDAVMLSGETASGIYPVESVKIMDAIIKEAEMHYSKWGHTNLSDSIVNEDAISITRAARTLAFDRNVTCIAVFTNSGSTALFMSKARPEVPIFAFTPVQRTYQCLGMYWGVTPFLVPYASSVESMLSYIETTLISQSIIMSGEQVVVVSSYPVGNESQANLLLLHTVG